MTRARFRFYAELNDFLPPARRQREFGHACARAATVKNAIEACGVPHTEVELILADGVSVDFSHRVAEGERIAVYPVFECFDVAPLLRVRAGPLRSPRFIADAHLGGLAHLLRMLGFDTRFDNGWTDEQIRAIAAHEHRIVLTRDIELLKCRDVAHGCFVHALKPAQQIGEIVRRLQLEHLARPLTLCLHCNRPLQPVGRAEVCERLPPAVRERYARYARCSGCDRVFWEGSHWRHMQAMLARLLPRPEGGAQRSKARPQVRG